MCNLSFENRIRSQSPLLPRIIEKLFGFIEFDAYTKISVSQNIRDILTDHQPRRFNRKETDSKQITHLRFFLEYNAQMDKIKNNMSTARNAEDDEDSNIEEIINSEIETR